MRLIDADALGLTDMEIIMCNGDYKEALKMLLNKIEHTPPIEERKTGKWIGAKYPFSKCSNCECYFDTANNVRNYCPNCGADMRGK